MPSFLTFIIAAGAVGLMTATSAVAEAPAAAASMRSRIFNAIDYGAVGDDKTDNTAAFSACLEALIEAGGGRMELPDGVFRGRIIIPPVFMSPPSRITVEIVGALEPTPVFGTIRSYALQDYGTILKCTDEQGLAVVTAMPPPKGKSLYQDSSALCVVLRNLDIRTTDNPRIGGVDLAQARQCKIEDVFINTGVYNVRASEPTHGTIGLVTPTLNNAAWTVLRNVTVTGYDTGILVNEHTDGDNIVIGGNIHGLRFAKAHHASRFARVSCCRNVHNVTVSGHHGFSIDQLDIEQAGAGQTDPQNAWQVTKSDVNDPDNQATGDITYWVVIGGIGAKDVFLKTGGESIQTRRIGSPRAP